MSWEHFRIRYLTLGTCHSVRYIFRIVIKNPNKKNKYQETKYDYDKMGRLTSVANPKGKAEKYSYDVYGNQPKTIARDGDTTSYNYDYQGRIIKETAKDKGTGRETVHTFTYDAYGNTISKDDTKLTYDKLTGLVTKEEEKVNGKAVAKAYDYDLSGNRTEMKVDVAGNIALDVSYKYDAAGRLIQVFSDGKEIVTYTYDEDGSIASETKSDTGVTTTYQYNYQGMVTDMKNKTSAGEELSSFTCTYDLNGRKVSEEDSVKTVNNKKQNTTKKYAYDQLNRLTKESQTEQDDISYQYDANNNRTGKILGDYETAYQYNKNNELLRVDILNRKTEKNDTVIYRYDANGNQVASNPRKAPKGKSPYVSLDVTLGSNKENENVVNHYNAKNELIRTLTKDKSVTYEYNADGLRTKKKNHDDVIYYIWDGDQLVLELDKDVKVTKRYLRGNSLITTDNGKGEITTYVTNPHGDVVQLLDKSGKVTKTYDYDAFGNEINPDEKDENPIRYAGEYFDVETGTQYLRARYYAPELGRFITRDTYTGEDEDSLSLHLYTYCENDGVNFSDPSGFIKYASETALAGMSLVLNKYIELKSKKQNKIKEWINNKNVGEIFSEDLNHRELRVCTDGKVSRIMKKSNFYGDLNHGPGNTTAYFGKKVAADEIPYIVVPPENKKYMHSLGVIIDKKKGDYLYAVVAEEGSKENGMGEISIYAAWKMKGIKPPHNNIVLRKHLIGNSGLIGNWRIIMFEKSSPNPRKKRSGWKFSDKKRFRRQIKLIGKKYYKGNGKCLN